MNIPIELQYRFAEKVYSCKADTLRKEQTMRKRILIEQLKKVKNKSIVFDKNDVHPSFVRERRIEKLCENLLSKIFLAKCGC